VFGIGIGRTGTLSLAYALRELGYKTVHYPQVPLLPELIEYMKGYDAGNDSPIAIAFKELDEAFPDSKFIVTTRSLNTWLRSCRNFIRFGRELKGDQGKVRRLMFGSTTFNKKIWKKAFLRHNLNVLEYFKDREDLLIMDFSKGDGWKELCEFLNKPVPDKEFPHRNKTKV
jgi:hypothetical protein